MAARLGSRALREKIGFWVFQLARALLKIAIWRFETL